MTTHELIELEPKASPRFYAGIGSRQTPEEMRDLIYGIVKRLNDYHFTLRSGGAMGADSMFEVHAALKEIYLPWRGFNRNASVVVQSEL